MFQVIKSLALLVNVFLLIQISLAAAAGGTGDEAESVVEAENPEIPQQPAGESSTHELHQDQLVQGATAKPNMADLKVNEDAFEALQNHFGNLGLLMYDAVTNRNALGDEFAHMSKVVTKYIDLEKYRHSIATILELADRTNFSERLTPLFERIANVPDPKGTETFGHAVEIITNVLQDEQAVDEIRQKITAPSRITL